MEIRSEIIITIGENDYIIKRPQDVGESIENLANTQQIDLEKMKQFIEEENTIFHFNEKLKMPEDDSDIKLVWIDSGYCTPKKEPIFISLLKNDDYYYSGYFVGTDNYLKNGICNKTNDVYTRKAIEKNYKNFKDNYYPEHVKNRKNQYIEISEDTTNITSFVIPKASFPSKLSSVTNQIYESLLFQNWNSIEGLDRYIKIIGKRIEQLVEQKKEDFYVINKIKTVIVNSGLLNTWGRDHLILYKYYEKYETYIAEKVIESKQDFLDNDFSKEQSSKTLQPISFFEEHEKNFTPTMEEFDIDERSLAHIIYKRKERFPKSLQQKSDNEFVTIIINALHRGLQMQMRDNSYAKAHYSGKTARISWLLPLHIDAKLTEEPELVMLIDKTENFYKIKTVLIFDDSLKDKITCLSLYRKAW